jgi:hypothetical protein
MSCLVSNNMKWLSLMLCTVPVMCYGHMYAAKDINSQYTNTTSDSWLVAFTVAALATSTKRVLKCTSCGTA